MISLVLALIFAAAAAPFDSLDVGPVENGLYEGSQSIILALAATLFLVGAYRFRGEIFYVCAVAALLCVFAVTRETPRCSSSFYDGGACLTADGKVYVFLAVVAAIVAILAIKREPLARRWSEMQFFYAVPCVLIALCLVASEVFGTHIYVWLEEIAETTAYLQILMLALLVNLRPAWFDARRWNERASARRNGFMSNEHCPSRR
ncbi:hypothetical protein DYI37_01720 [Fulvimarina endophytica]|uniref:DUF998 domain-containing protein n=1 Tax=Fulvimarina endophytica TaxID=2293836 RepID=A0A371XAD7_9HYPH|nr:hypothetical protein DYI37_01720 [Fulvimarina endophytica]